MEIAHEEAVVASGHAYVQCALLYTSSNGERRIRCATTPLSLPPGARPNRHITPRMPTCQPVSTVSTVSTVSNLSALTALTNSRPPMHTPPSARIVPYLAPHTLPLSLTSLSPRLPTPTPNPSLP